MLKEENNINHSYNMICEVLSPLHIGAGSEKDWVKGLDFIQDKGKLVKLNTRKMYEVLSNDIYKLSNYLAKNNKKDNELNILLGGKIDLVKEQVFDFNSKNSNDIKSFIKTGLENKPYIPGSSLKGAIRSILLKHFLNGDKPKYNNFEKDYFGSSTDGDEFMRFVKISDAHFEKTELVNTKIFNLKSKNVSEFYSTWKPDNFNTIYEIIKPNEKSQIFTISLSQKQVENFNLNRFYEQELEKAEKIFDENKKKNKIKSIKTLQELVAEKNKLLTNATSIFEIINEYTKEYIKREIDFFKKYSNEQSDNIIQNLEKILDYTTKENSCVLRMSAGSGFHSVTGDWQFSEHYIDEIEVYKGRSRGKYQHKKSAKSRRIAVSDENYMPMGFVKLKVVTDEEIQQKEQEEAEKRKIELQKAEQKRIESKKQEILKQQFNNLLTEADNLFAEKQYKKAIEKYNEAQKLDENVNLTMFLKKCEDATEKQKAEQEKEKKRIESEEFLKQKEQEEEERQKANKKQLEELENQGYKFLENETNFANGRNIVEKFRKKVPVTENDNPYIKKFIQNCIKTESDKNRKNFNRDDNWKKIASWVGKETAEKLFNEIIK